MSKKIVVVNETAHFWNVKCGADGCDVKIAVPKRLRDPISGKTRLISEPSPRWCASHPPGSVAR